MSEIQPAKGSVTIETDAFGGTTVITPAHIAQKQRELARLLRPDHACTGAGGVGVRADGSHYSYSRPCSGCVAQRERVLKQRPDLAPESIRVEPDYKAAYYEVCEEKNALEERIFDLIQMGLDEDRGVTNDSVCDKTWAHALEKILNIHEGAK